MTKTANDKMQATVSDLDAVVGCLLEPALAQVAAGLDAISGLTQAERNVVHSATATALCDTVRRKTNLVLLVELNAARITGRLTAADSRARWKEWVASAASPEFWDSLTDHYPTLRKRLRQVIDNRCAAALRLARRFATDRSSLGALVGSEPGELIGIDLSAGDSHRGGHTVAILRCTAGRIVYKPRSVAVDAALDLLLERLFAGEPAGTRIRVPAVLPRDGYGWAEHVEHRYCADDEELRDYYRNLGHWLAVMRMLGGSDLHAENVVAVGPLPTVVDCETLFTPRPPAGASGYGLAIDRAAAMVGASVLSTGLLPNRGLALGLRGIDMSAMGALPDQQPAPLVRLIVDAGTDLARVGYGRAAIPAAVNHPSPNPTLGRYWGLVVDGFTALTQRLRSLDREGVLEPLLAGFATLPIRVVLRSSESYVELERMLWHPESLHDEPAARKRAADLLARQAENLPGAPSDPQVINAEIGELLNGDVPFFTTTPRHGTLSGPRGTTWGSAQDLIHETMRRWRAADLALERQVIQSALVGAYLHEGWLPDVERLLPAEIRSDDLDRRRRTLAADIVRALADFAVRAEDGTATWIAPVLNQTGWAVQPLGLDLYGGISGIAVLLAGYLNETKRDRADPVPAAEPLLDAVLRTIRRAEEQWRTDLAAAGGKVRPEPVGGYLGLASRIWAWLLLWEFGVIGWAEALSRAGKLAEEVAEAMPADTSLDLMRGMAGAVVPLMRFAEFAADAGAAALASEIGRRLVSAAQVRDGTACWPTSDYPQGIGGVSHGATGIGWALFRLAASTGDPEVGAMADGAFAYEETLYDPARGGWRDVRSTDGLAATWCHGAGGIGVVAADRLRHNGGDRRAHDVLRRAAAACWSTSMGWNHTLCHGDLGAWELLDTAIAAGAGPPGLTRSTVDATIIGSIEEHGPVSGLARDAFAPGLVPGLGGVAYQLLRMHPDCPLPSVLLPDPGTVNGR